MKTGNRQSSIQDDRNGVVETLREMDPRLCFMVGLFGCAIVAFYIPSVIIALTGVWVNNLTMLVPLLLAVFILVIQNLVGNLFRKILLVGIIFAVVFNCCEVYLMIHTAVNPTWRNWWMVYFFPTTACLLNAGLFLRFRKATSLE